MGYHQCLPPVSLITICHTRCLTSSASSSSSGSDAGSPRSNAGGVERAKVTFDYEAEEDDNITISVGDVVVVSDKSDADWWEGHVEGKADKVGFSLRRLWSCLRTVGLMVV